MQAVHCRTAAALGNERNIFACAEKGRLDLGIGKEPEPGFPLSPPLHPPPAGSQETCSVVKHFVRCSSWGVRGSRVTGGEGGQGVGLPVPRNSRQSSNCRDKEKRLGKGERPQDIVSPRITTHDQGLIVHEVARGCPRPHRAASPKQC